MRFRDMVIKLAPHDDAGNPAHEVAHHANILQTSCSRIYAARNRCMMTQAKESGPSISDDVAKQYMKSAVNKVIIITRNEHILEFARFDSSMDVSFRADVLLVAMVAQIPIFFLHFFNKYPVS